MQRILSSGRAFWTDPVQRKTFMWVLAALSFLVVAYGAYTALDGHRQYTTMSDKVTDIVARRDAYTQQFPLVEDNGVMKPDLSTATQADLMVIAMSRSDELKADAQRIDADNQRRNGVRIIGIGAIGIALAYIISPAKPKPSPDQSDQSSDISNGPVI